MRHRWGEAAPPVRGASVPCKVGSPLGTGWRGAQQGSPTTARLPGTPRVGENMHRGFPCGMGFPEEGSYVPPGEGAPLVEGLCANPVSGMRK